VLRTNLSTRPFYNERPIRLGILVAVIAVAAWTAFNATQVMTLTQRNAELSGRAETAEGRAGDLRTRAGATQKALDQGEVVVVQASAREANMLIDRRAFSWTDLFNRFEETLPADVRIAAVQPQQDEEGRLLIAATVISRRVEDLDQFIENLEKTGVFSAVLPRGEAPEEDGSLRTVIQGYYAPAAVPLARIARDHRAALLPLGIVLAINVIVVVVVLWPLGRRVAANETRSTTAERALATANNEFTRAEAARSGSARASTDLETFYAKVLPPDVTAARRMTHVRFQQKAREHGVRYQRGAMIEEAVKESSLNRLSVSISLTGEYEDIRALLYELENSDDFFVIENVALSEGGEAGEPLSVALSVSTYYRGARSTAPPESNGR
jgi:Tfp pilus assembly protein PilO